MNFTFIPLSATYHPRVTSPVSSRRSPSRRIDKGAHCHFALSFPVQIEILHINQNGVRFNDSTALVHRQRRRRRQKSRRNKRTQRRRRQRRFKGRPSRARKMRRGVPEWQKAVCRRKVGSRDSPTATSRWGFMAPTYRWSCTGLNSGGSGGPSDPFGLTIP